jgi:predicted dehydrogenase
VRFAIVGVGANVFKMHADALRRLQIELVGVCDINVAAAEHVAENSGCAAFSDHRAMLAATQPEVSVVLAPHPFHAQLAVDCLSAGTHVLVEKPLADEVAEADRMIDVSGSARKLLAVSLQHRTRAEIRTAKRLIESGALGEIQRVELVAIWTRTARYYALAGWRGTWRGEGGGVLMNQAPHSLDLVCHLAGQPSRVMAWNRTRFHTIETEDTSMAMLEWSNGALGTLFVSTAHAGTDERLEITGTRGSLRLGRGGLELSAILPELREFLSTSPEPFGRPALNPVSVELDAGAGNHYEIYTNLLSAISGGGPLVADGSEGRKSLELANALILSSHTGQPVELPLDRVGYKRLLASLRK